MSAFMVTDRDLRPGQNQNNWSPLGNTWWVAAGKPFVGLSNWSALNQADALADIKSIGKPVVVFVHGFNNSLDKAMGTLQALSDGLGDTYTLIAYCWPSDGSVLDYLQDRKRAELSAIDFLQALRDMECPNVIAHSMGNYLLQKAMDIAGTAPCVNNLVMVAADVDFDALNKSQIANLSAYGTVMYSYRDGALWGSSDIHLAARLGLVGPGRECPPNFHGVNCTFKMSIEVVIPTAIHGEYFKSAECLSIMREALAMGGKSEAATA